VPFDTRPPQAALTIAQGWALATDPEKGKWPTRTPHRDEMRRAFDRAQAAWGAATPWAEIGRGEIRQLWRRELKAQRAQGNAGVRAAEVVVARVLTVADWLRNEQHIDPLACTRWPAWKHELAADAGEYEPKRGRYTADEYRRYITAAPRVDARYGLLVALGAELRLGQVVRAHRRDVALEGTGQLRIRGAGLKRGTVVVLTPGQRASLVAAMAPGGFLHGLEEAFQAGRIETYPLFPGWHLPMRDGVPVTAVRHAGRGALNRTTLRQWHLATEKVADIAHVDGRGWYALRRAAVDESKRLGISREGLQAQGGWSTSQMPDRIYADQEALAASEEAARYRAIARGESSAEPTQNDTRPTEGQAVTEDENGC
jgi:integrase